MFPGKRTVIVRLTKILLGSSLVTVNLFPAPALAVRDEVFWVRSAAAATHREAPRIAATDAFHTMLKHNVLVKVRNAYIKAGYKNVDIDVRLQGTLFVNKSDEAWPAVRNILECVPTAIEDAILLAKVRNARPFGMIVVKGLKKGEAPVALVEDWFGLPTEPRGIYVNVERTDDGRYTCP
jgi:hypothetical protein